MKIKKKYIEDTKGFLDNFMLFLQSDFDLTYYEARSILDEVRLFLIEE